MKKIAACLTLLVMVVPAYAAFDLNTTETFDSGMGGWTTNGAVSLVTESSGNSYAKLAEIGNNRDNWIARQFTAVNTGDYALSFDYRFKGVDTSTSNDTANIGIMFVDENLNTFSSATDLNNTNNWRHVLAPPPSVLLDGGKDYWVFFRLNEAPIPGGEVTDFSLMTTLHLDNIDLNYLGKNTHSQVVPTPGALILGTIGISLVGFLRRRNAL